jgi:hyperosmotically inducible protein
LQADPETQSLAINVDSREGVVQLSGFVDSPAQTEKAAQIAQAVPGVRSVENKLGMRAAADAAPAGSTAKVSVADDSMITNHLKESLLGDPYLNNIDVAVVTRDGEVQLSGFVSNQDQADDVIAAARKIEGVKNVVSTLSVGSGGEFAQQPDNRPVEPLEQQPAEQPASQPGSQ